MVVEMHLREYLYMDDNDRLIIHPDDHSMMAALYTMASGRIDDDAFQAVVEEYLRTQYITKPERRSSSFYLSDAGFRIHLGEDSSRDNFRVYCTAKDGRICSAKISCSMPWRMHEFPLVVPKAFGSPHATHLQSLAIHSCSIASLPKSLSELPSLVHLTLDGCSTAPESQSSLPWAVNFPRLTTLVVSNSDLPSQAHFFRWIEDCLPALHRLEIRRCQQLLLDPSVTRFPPSLRELVLDICGIDEFGLETLLFDILPLQQGRLEVLDLPNNIIQTIEPIRNRILRIGEQARWWQGYAKGPSTLFLAGNPVEHKLYPWTPGAADEAEIIALCTLLRGFSTIKDGIVERVCLGFNEFNPGLTSTRVLASVPNHNPLYELLLNRGGRSVLEGKHSGAVGPPPSTMWPALLAALYQKAARSVAGKDAAPSVLYYFLRHGAISAGR